MTSGDDAGGHSCLALLGELEGSSFGRFEEQHPSGPLFEKQREVGQEVAPEQRREMLQCSALCRGDRREYVQGHVEGMGAEGSIRRHPGRRHDAADASSERARCELAQVKY